MLLYWMVAFYFKFLDIWDLIELYSGHISPISLKILLYRSFIFIPKGTELFSISSLILCFIIDRDTSYSFSR